MVNSSTKLRKQKYFVYFLFGGRNHETGIRTKKWLRSSNSTPLCNIYYFTIKTLLFVEDIPIKPLLRTFHCGLRSADCRLKWSVVCGLSSKNLWQLPQRPHEHYCTSALWSGRRHRAVRLYSSSEWAKNHF